MKSHWLNIAVVLATLALCAVAKEEETDHLQNLQEGRQTVDDVADTVQDTANTVSDSIQDLLTGGDLDSTISNIMLALGNVFGLLDDIDLTSLTPTLAAGGTAAGLAGAAAAGTTAISAISTVKSAVLGLLLKPLDFVNGILAIIGLVLLIAYLINTEGDIYGLVGSTGYLRREADEYYDSYSTYVNTARSFIDAPIVQRLATAVQEAITKYD